jgi:[acyl-carrier-protein] S-malonyltransferase
VLLVAFGAGFTWGSMSFASEPARMRPLVLLFPRAGLAEARHGRDLADAHPAARAVFEAVDAALGAPLSRLCFEGPADELTLTHNAQPALLAHGAAVWRRGARRARRPRARRRRPLARRVHRLPRRGCALAEAAARLVRRRGELMYHSGVSRPGAMAALLGDPTQPIEELCAIATREAGVVVPANYNSPASS